jgi:hypothetical protein
MMLNVGKKTGKTKMFDDQKSRSVFALLLKGKASDWFDNLDDDVKNNLMLSLMLSNYVIFHQTLLNGKELSICGKLINKV